MFCTSFLGLKPPTGWNSRLPIHPSTSISRYRTRHAQLSSLRNISFPYWQNISRWKDVTHRDFLSYRWQVANCVQNSQQLCDFLASVLPSEISAPQQQKTFSPSEFIKDVRRGLNLAPMSVRLTPHILSVIDWREPMEDPVRKQFIPLGSTSQEDHTKLRLDSLSEQDDSPVRGLVHRYPDKALFLASSVCPVYCRFCTRSYAVGAETETVTKTRFLPIQKKWEKMFDYIERTPSLHDIVVSGGDTYSIDPAQLDSIGDRLLSIPHIQRIRLASKGLAVCPSRILDESDSWARTIIQLSNRGRRIGKSVALHTHFNHPNEITWITSLAAQKLFENGVTVRNQTVLLKGVNNELAVMQQLIRNLAELNIQPYYVYQGDMVRCVEDLRTPLQEILDLESKIRGTIAGFMTPAFVVDLPGGGGKRLANSYESYDRASGRSVFRAPGVTGTDRLFEYYDPLST